MSHQLPCSHASRKAWGLLLIITLPLFAISSIYRQERMFFQPLLLAIGWLCWTFLEYYLHRFIMHDAKGRTDPRKHAEHHRHHVHPHELRVVAWHRVVLSAAALAFGLLSYWTNSWFALLAGFQTGLATYAITHWMLHRPIAERLLPRLHRYHTHHHCVQPAGCYGVTITWWDVLLGTRPRADRKPGSRVMAFYFGQFRTP